jgi:16S rRNA (adenine1518-N6/adenine1519-N6)-dimethyltransferase
MVKAKKSLGQNFLKSDKALSQIISAGNIGTGDVVLEIGPGKGALTEKILKQAGKVIAVEKDRELLPLLKEKFQVEISNGKLNLVEKDILQFDPSTLRYYKIIANIPYNITGAILKKFLTAENQPETMVLMVQHEVAKRIVARDKKESILSISVKAYGVPRIIAKVDARYFSPAPKVNSAIIAIRDISRRFFQNNHVNEEYFWKILHLGFAHKRKKLSSNLRKGVLFGLNEIFFDKLKNERAENLSIFDWATLVNPERGQDSHNNHIKRANHYKK